MSAETALWILGAALVPMVAALIYIINGIRDLIYMHRNPEKFEFGTVGVHELIAENTRAFKDMSRWVKWLTEELGHSQPPPQVGDD